MAFEFTMRHQIPFADTDMAGIVHFSNFFRYMENTEHAFYRSLGASVVSQEAEAHVGWPRVHASCDYLKPLRFEDVLEVVLLVREKRAKAIVYDFVFSRVEPEPRLVVARGKLIVVSVQFDPHSGRMQSVALPAGLAAQIDVAPAERLTEGVVGS